MNVIREIGPSADLDALDGSECLSRQEARTTIAIVSDLVAEAVLVEVGEASPVLCVFILRGGALLIPGFSRHLASADYCISAMRRNSRGHVDTEYVSAVAERHYGSVVYVDCIVGTGETMVSARAAITQRCSGDRHVAAVVYSSAPATRRLASEGFDVVGCRLQEQLNGDIVQPDLGRLDAGDVFSSAQGSRRSSV